MDTLAIGLTYGHLQANMTRLSNAEFSTTDLLAIEHTFAIHVSTHSLVPCSKGKAGG